VTLTDLFQRMQSFFQRLEIYTEVPPTEDMMDVIVKTMVEVLSILAMITKDIKQRGLSEFTLGNISYFDSPILFRKVSQSVDPGQFQRP
jgi:hypothetical protein